MSRFEDRFSDEYDPEPDYERPTRAEAEWEERGYPEYPEPAPWACPATEGTRRCCYRAGHDLDVFPHRFMEPDNDEPYCDYCEETGHRFSSCPKRDDVDPPEWPDFEFGIGPLCEEDPEQEGRCAYHRTEH